MQLPVAAQLERVRSNSYRIDLRYVASHDEDQRFCQGHNFGAARLMRNGERRFWNAELIPILGYRLDRWHLIVNSGNSHPLTGRTEKSGSSRRPRRLSGHRAKTISVSSITWRRARYAILLPGNIIPAFYTSLRTECIFPAVASFHVKA